MNPLKKLYQSLPVIRELCLMSRQEASHHFTHGRKMETISLIQALEALKAGNERYRDPQRLLVHGAQYWSQNYEDGMIAEIFRRIGTTTRTFVEVGVGEGVENNTAVLLAGGWTGWWIEGDAKNCAKIESWLKSPKAARARLKIRQAYVSPDNIKACFSELGIPAEVDLFSLDIDLDTYHIWASLKEFRPRVVVVEYNAGFPPEMAWIHPYHPGQMWDYTQIFGASLKAFEHLGAGMGYSLVGCDITGINAFFVRNDLLADRFAAPYTSENHYEPVRYGLTHRWGHQPSLPVLE